MTNTPRKTEPFQTIVPTKAMNMFLFPFSFDRKNKEQLVHALEANLFEFFSIQNKHLEKEYYVSHDSLEQYFLPYIECILFPDSCEKEGLLRFSKKIGHSITLHTSSTTVSSNVLSV